MIRFASRKPRRLWKRRLSVFSSSQSLANSVQPQSLAQSSQAASKAAARPLRRYGSAVKTPSR